jgi:chemotaxis protein histidine kinase CheA
LDTRWDAATEEEMNSYLAKLQSLSSSASPKFAARKKDNYGIEIGDSTKYQGPKVEVSSQGASSYDDLYFATSEASSLNIGGIFKINGELSGNLGSINTTNVVDAIVSSITATSIKIDEKEWTASGQWKIQKGAPDERFREILNAFKKEEEERKEEEKQRKEEEEMKKEEKEDEKEKKIGGDEEEKQKKEKEEKKKIEEALKELREEKDEEREDALRKLRDEKDEEKDKEIEEALKKLRDEKDEEKDKEIEAALRKLREEKDKEIEELRKEEEEEEEKTRKEEEKQKKEEEEKKRKEEKQREEEEEEKRKEEEEKKKIEEELSFITTENNKANKAEAKQNITLPANIVFNDQLTWEEALKVHFLGRFTDNNIGLKKVSHLGCFTISPGNSLSQLIKEKTEDGNEQITLNLSEMRNVVVKGLDGYKKEYNLVNYAKYIEPIRQELISNEFLKKLREIARKKAEEKIKK